MVSAGAQALEFLGGADAVAENIAAEVRKKLPDHPIATTENPAEVIGTMTRSDLLDLLFVEEIVLSEAMPLNLDEVPAETLEGWKQEMQGGE